MKTLYLIRHGKSSWLDLEYADYDRPLSKRGKENSREMGRRLRGAGLAFDLIISSPAKRARSTTRRIAKRLGYPRKNIVFSYNLYLTDVEEYSKNCLDYLRQVDSVALVGHNGVITDFAEYLTGAGIENIPTAGVVAIELESFQDVQRQSAGRMVFFDYPKNVDSPLLVS
ncbi:SixA phosphatase family protein [Desulfotalea psychrophila]|uniref:Histidine phosphatase family protein n=1 Tax=Desulfotalea psychrophila (strain LSv54 / DSM 12343) TaxID=177439 RepID=Q6AJL1_DESPS|nr:histidine phosphatase family protein [Desulfotalea psychrophila]CAG37469.1 conserved hypothetical protein [Desulfotalea psychrophila LSv54]